VENFLILGNVRFVMEQELSLTEERLSKLTTTTTINPSPSDGSARSATTNGTEEINLSQRGKEVKRKRQPWILSTAASRNHAKTSALQEMEQVWKESEVGFSLILSDSSKRQERLGCFSKMYQPLELEALNKSSNHLPIWGMIVGGLAYLPQKLEPVTCAKGGSFLPTIGANEFMGSGRKRFKGSPHFRGAKMSEGLRLRLEDPIYTHPSFAELAMGYPLEWSVLRDWVMQWFRSKPKQHL